MESRALAFVLEQVHQRWHLDFRTVAGVVDCCYCRRAGSLCRQGSEHWLLGVHMDGSSFLKKRLDIFLTDLAAVQWSVSCEQMEDVISCWSSVCCSKELLLVFSREKVPGWVGVSGWQPRGLCCSGSKS